MCQIFAASCPVQMNPLTITMAAYYALQMLLVAYASGGCRGKILMIPMMYGETFCKFPLCSIAHIVFSLASVSMQILAINFTAHNWKSKLLTNTLIYPIDDDLPSAVVNLKPKAEV